MSPFDRAFERTIGHEGGYVNDPRDPGGETKYGISKRSNPDIDIAALTLEKAKQLYRMRYWHPMFDKLPDPIAIEMFDTSVHAGLRVATHFLQRALGNVADDGMLGPKTVAACVVHPNPQLVVSRMLGYRLSHLTDLATWPTHGRGWARRVARNLIGG